MTTGTTSSLAALTGDYTIDPAHSYIGFVAGHAMISRVRGAFAEYTGSGHLDGTSVGDSRVDFTVQLGSVDTGFAARDEALRAEGFFDVEHHPHMQFVSTSVAPRGEDGLTVTGDLTVRGVTRPLTIDFTVGGTAEDPFGNVRLGLTGTATLDRRDFGLEWNVPLKTGGVLVGNAITLELEVSAIKATA